MEGPADVPRFQVLEEIPGAIRFITERLEEAWKLPPPPNSRKHKDLVVPAGRKAREMLEQLGGCTPLWLALQRQALVRGWSFGDLEQLDKLDVVATARLLKALNVRSPRDFEADIEDYLDRLVTDAQNHVRDVKTEVVEAARSSGIDLPVPGRDGTASWVVDSVVVDHTHEKLDELRFMLAELLARGGWRKFDVESLERLLMATAAATTIAGFTVVMVPHIPGAWEWVRESGGELAQLFEAAMDAGGRMVSPLLSSVLVVRAVDITLEGPGSQPGPENMPPVSPDDLQPSPDPRSAIAGVDLTSHAEPPAAPAQQPATKSTDESLSLPPQDDPSNEPEVESEVTIEAPPGVVVDTVPAGKPVVADDIDLVGPEEPYPSQGNPGDLDEIVDRPVRRPAPGSPGRMSP
jgi:hypothetical protein